MNANIGPQLVHDMYIGRFSNHNLSKKTFPEGSMKFVSTSKANKFWSGIGPKTTFRAQERKDLNETDGRDKHENRFAVSS